MTQAFKPRVVRLLEADTAGIARVLNPRGTPRRVSESRALIVVSDRRERLRRWLVRLSYAFFLLLPLEGILRKWLLPQLQAPLLLIRDPIAVLMLAGYLIYQSPRLPRWAALWLGAVAITSAWCFLQVLLLDIPAPVVLFGLRNYLMFMPVAFVIRDTFRRDDWVRFVTLCCWVAVPSALLVIVQFFSPASSGINRGIDADAAVFTVANGIVRPYGPFTFTAAQTAFAGFLTAVLVAAWDQAPRWNMSRRTLAIGLAAVFVMGALSGSRGFFLGAALIILTYVAGGLLSRDVNAAVTRAAGGVIGVLAFLAVLVFVFPSSFAAIQQRQANAVASEGSTLVRAFGILNPFAFGGAEPSILGEGLGVGSNAGAFASAGRRVFTLGEDELPRVILEAGIPLGAGFLLFRLSLVISLAFLAYRALAITDSGGGFALLGFAAPLLLAAQITGQSQFVSFAWLFAGLALSFNRLAASRCS